MLLPFFNWLNGLPVSQAIGSSIWIYPLVQAIHLVFLALFAGAILMVDLRLLGVTLRSQSMAQVARDARPWLIAGFLGMVCTGIPQLMQNASREYYSEYFWYKMYLIAFGLIFTMTIRRKVSQGTESSPASKVVGLVSIMVWGSVVVNARLIGLFT